MSLHDWWFWVAEERKSLNCLYYFGGGKVRHRSLETVKEAIQHSSIKDIKWSLKLQALKISLGKAPTNLGFWLNTPPLKYFITSDRTYWNHILGFRVWAFLSSKWLKLKKSDEPFLRNHIYDFLIIFLWFSLKGPIRFFCCQSIIVQGGPNVEF